MSTKRFEGWPSILVAAVVVFGLTWTAGSASAFTEPTEAPPGGSAIAAPINVSATTQTKTGHLILSGTYAGNLVPALSVGDVSPNEKRICWNGDCRDGWSSVTGSAIRNGPTPAWQQPIPSSSSDQGFVAVGAQDNSQVFAIGGQAADPQNLFSAGIYGSSFSGQTVSASTQGRSYGVLGVAHAAFSAGPPGGFLTTAGVVGVTSGGGPAGLFIGNGTVPTGLFQNGPVGVNFQTLPSGSGGMYVNGNLAPSPSVSIADAGAFYISSNGSAIYAEQQGTAASSYAGYFSGRVGIYHNNPSAPDVATLEINRGTGSAPGQDFYKMLSFITNDEEQWNWRVFSKCCTPYVPYLTLNTVSGGTDRVVLSFDPSGKVSVGEMVQVGPQFIVNKYTSQGGNDTDAVAFYYDSENGGAIPDPAGGSGLYVEQASDDPDVYAGYFSGNVGITNATNTAKLCLNGTCVTSLSGGPGGSYWQLVGSVVSPLTPTRKVAIGGTADTAPFYFDPEANIVSLTGGNLALNDGALTLKQGPGGGRRDDDEVSDQGNAVQRFADVLRPRAALAGSVTNPGGAPPVRLFVRDGVVSIETAGTKLELGNAGRDIASNSNLYLRPDSLTAADAVRVAAFNSRSRIITPALLLANPATEAPLTQDTIPFRIAHDNPGANPSFNVTNTVTGSGSGVQSWLFGANNTGKAIEAVNLSMNGQAGFFNGRLVVNRGVNDSGNVDDAVGIYANSPASALYAYQANAAAGAYAGYFQGRTHVQGEFGIGTSAFPITTNSSLQAYNSSTSANRYNAVSAFKTGAGVRGSAIYGELSSTLSCADGDCAAVYGSWGNGGPNKWAGYFNGNVRVAGDITGVDTYVGSGPPFDAYSLRIIGATTTGDTFVENYGLYVKGGVAHSLDSGGAYGATSVGILAEGGSAYSDSAPQPINSLIGILARPGTGSGAEIDRWAGVFEGPIRTQRIREQNLSGTGDHDVMSVIRGNATDTCSARCSTQDKSCLARFNPATLTLAACTTAAPVAERCLCGDNP